MLFPGTICRAVRVFTVAKPCQISSATHVVGQIRSIRPISSSPKIYQKDTRSGGGHVSKAGDTQREGSFSRTDKEVEILHPDEKNMPRSEAVAGRGGSHFRRTLPSFSLEGRVGVVTGGAQGLGLVMSQALVISGADVAIVDLNSKHE